MQHVNTNILKLKILTIIKVNQSNYSKYELKKFSIQIYPLVDFAKYYNVSVDRLCGKTKDSVIK